MEGAIFFNAEYKSFLTVNFIVYLQGVMQYIWGITVYKIVMHQSSTA